MVNYVHVFSRFLLLRLRHVLSFSSIVVHGYIWRFAKRVDASIFFRGIRTWEKDGTEERSLALLNTWGPILLGPLVWPIPTIYLEGDPKYNHVSSTLIRDICNKTNDESTQKILNELVLEKNSTTIAELYCVKRK